MKTKHVFVPALDVGELLPFAVKETATLEESFAEQDRAKKELVKFIDKLEKNLKQKIFYLGFDVIGEKSYERFIFDKGGFLEVMVESPLALNAHFVHDDQAKKFEKALKTTLASVLPKGPASRIFIDSIELQDQEDTSLTVQKWNTMKDMRG
ncbi:MAG: hypothetical protein AABY13_04015 [Nanoarchaeota archaeon]